MSNGPMQTQLQDFSIYCAIRAQIDHARVLYRHLLGMWAENAAPPDRDSQATQQLTPDQQQAMLRLGMVPLADLRDGARYLGYCRNATDAVWHAELQVFRYRRSKLGILSDEDVLHPETPQEDGGGDEIFVPTSEIVGAA